MSGMSAVPADEPALALAIDFLNTYDALNDPPDGLNVTGLQRIATRHGTSTEDLRPADLEPLRELRELLRPVFANPHVDAKISALNLVFRDLAADVQVAHEDGRVSLRASGGRDPVGRFGIVVADALAQALSTGGADRFGTCAAEPCHCVYVDRTRSGRQRYCCELCNDRMAAAAYRKRGKS
jgi:predicted RNA-binding Zn ribbon-like protein